MNSISIIGRLTADAEIKTTPSGKNYTKFNIAVDRTYGKETDFFNVTAWNKTADFVSTYFHKGELIAITGELQTNKWEDKNGNKRTDVFINANNVSFCGNKKANTDIKVDESFTVLDEPFTNDDGDLPF